MTKEYQKLSIINDEILDEGFCLNHREYFYIERTHITQCLKQFLSEIADGFKGTLELLNKALDLQTFDEIQGSEFDQFESYKIFQNCKDTMNEVQKENFFAAFWNTCHGLYTEKCNMINSETDFIKELLNLIKECFINNEDLNAMLSISTNYTNSGDVLDQLLCDLSSSENSSPSFQNIKTIASQLQSSSSYTPSEVFLQNIQHIIQAVFAPPLINVSEIEQNIQVSYRKSFVNLQTATCSIREKLIENDKDIKDIQEMKISATELLIVNQDLPNTDWHGKNIVITSKEIRVTDESTWDVSGQSAHHITKKAANAKESGMDGEDGEHGNHGESGGNILIVANKVYNIKKLTVKSNGGNGSDGQDGGDGKDGMDGKDGFGLSLNEFRKKFPSPAVTNGEEIKCAKRKTFQNFKVKIADIDQKIEKKSDYYHYQIETTDGNLVTMGYRDEKNHDTWAWEADRQAYCIHYGTKGTKGGRGGNGGSAGEAGLGGHAGEIKFYSMSKGIMADNSNDIHMERRNGNDGKKGKGGNGGHGGKNGKKGDDNAYVDGWAGEDTNWYHANYLKVKYCEDYPDDHGSEYAMCPVKEQYAYIQEIPDPNVPFLAERGCDGSKKTSSKKQTQRRRKATIQTHEIIGKFEREVQKYSFDQILTFEATNTRHLQKRALAGNVRQVQQRAVFVSCDAEVDIKLQKQAKVCIPPFPKISEAKNQNVGKSETDFIKALLNCITECFINGEDLQAMLGISTKQSNSPNYREVLDQILYKLSHDEHSSPNFQNIKAIAAQLQSSNYYSPSSFFVHNFTQLMQDTLAPPLIKISEMEQNIQVSYCGSFVNLQTAICSIKEKLIENDKDIKDIQEMKISATELLIVNQDLPNTDWHGKNIVITSKEIRVTNESTWDVSGQSAHEHIAKKAASGKESGMDGEDGEHGNHGESGGNILIVANKVYDIKKLTVKSNGGNGSDGQDGGDGKDGMDGKDGFGLSLKEFQNRFPSPAVTNDEEIKRAKTKTFQNFKVKIADIDQKIEKKSDYYHHQTETNDGNLVTMGYRDEKNHDTWAWEADRQAYCIHYGTKGTKGGRGGNGGSAGEAGLGGHAGEIKFYSMSKGIMADNSNDIHMERRNGNDGKKGKGGNGGHGGKNGKKGDDNAYVDGWAGEDTNWYHANYLKVKYCEDYPDDHGSEYAMCPVKEQYAYIQEIPDPNVPFLAERGCDGNKKTSSKKQTQWRRKATIQTHEIIGKFERDREKYSSDETFAFEVYENNMEDDKDEILDRIVLLPIPQDAKGCLYVLSSFFEVEGMNLLRQVVDRFYYEGLQIPVETFKWLITSIIRKANNSKTSKINIVSETTRIFASKKQTKWLQEYISVQLKMILGRTPLKVEEELRLHCSQVEDQTWLLLLSQKLAACAENSDVASFSRDHIKEIIASVSKGSLDKHIESELRSLELHEWPSQLQLHREFVLLHSLPVNMSNDERRMEAVYCIWELRNTQGHQFIEKLTESLTESSKTMEIEELHFLVLLKHMFNNIWPCDSNTLNIIATNQCREWENLLKNQELVNEDRNLDELLEMMRGNSNNSIPEEKFSEVSILMSTIKKKGKLLSIIEQKTNCKKSPLSGLPQDSQKQKPIDEFEDADIHFWTHSLYSLRKTNPNVVKENKEEVLAVIQQGIKLKRKYYLRDTQMIAIVLFLLNNQRGMLEQVSTGEGKSLIVVALAVFKYLSGETVDIITSSSVLAKHDAEENQDIYKLFVPPNFHQNSEYTSSPVSHICSEDVDERKKAYKSAIVYGEISTFQRDILLDEFYNENITGERKNENVIVDEVDSMLLDKGQNILYLSHNVAGLDSLEQVYVYIWSFVHSQGLTGTKEDEEQVYKMIMNAMYGTLQLDHIQQALHRNASAGQREGSTLKSDQLQEIWQELIDEKTIDKDGRILKSTAEINASSEIKFPEEIFDSSHREEIVACVKCALKDTLRKGSMFSVPHYLEPFIERHLKTWITNAFTARFLNESEHYIVDVDRTSNFQEYSQIIIMDIDTGTEQYSSQWNQGLHQFLQLKHGCRISPESLKAVFISNISFFKKYTTNIYGLTGTLGSEKERSLLQELYSIEYVTIPTFRPTKRIKEEGIVCSSQEQWLQQITTCVQEESSTRPVLVICETIKEIETIERYLNHTGIDPHIYQHSYQKMDIFSNPDAVTKNCVILATNLAGRGTDIKISEETSKAGGLYVLLTYLPNNI